MAGSVIASGLELPEEVVLNVPLVSIRGGESVTIENYKRLLGFSSEEAEILTKIGRLSVKGEGLYLEYMKKDIIKIKGKIYQVVTGTF